VAQEESWANVASALQLIPPRRCCDTASFFTPLSRRRVVRLESAARRTVPNARDCSLHMLALPWNGEGAVLGQVPEDSQEYWMGSVC
jgi:hypothetical protein